MGSGAALPAQEPRAVIRQLPPFLPQRHCGSQPTQGLGRRSSLQMVTCCPGCCPPPPQAPRTVTSATVPRAVPRPRTGTSEQRPGTGTHDGGGRTQELLPPDHRAPQQQCDTASHGLSNRLGRPGDEGPGRRHVLRRKAGRGWQRWRAAGPGLQRVPLAPLPWRAQGHRDGCRDPALTVCPDCIRLLTLSQARRPTGDAYRGGHRGSERPRRCPRPGPRLSLRAHLLGLG